MSDLSHDAKESGMWLIYTISILSNFATTMVILWMIAKKTSHVVPTRLVLNLLVADWIQSVSFMMSMYWTAWGNVYTDLAANGLFQKRFPREFYVVAACLFAANGLTDSVIYGCISYVASSKPLIEHHNTIPEDKSKGKKKSDNSTRESKKAVVSNSQESFFENKDVYEINNASNTSSNTFFPFASSSRSPESGNNIHVSENRPPTTNVPIYELVQSSSSNFYFM
ncbi:12652_t:CDS:2 [Ambispora gerdemannii]|uniref:12652_t:CDS:1 n=1 Tax=Ambispora gerdemannii TaxID=144530 RepID=A0A9N9API5_9GLOM|nr:12652_t:CDS:2 [Ambispora gerdemannii]